MSNIPSNPVNTNWTSMVATALQGAEVTGVTVNSVEKTEDGNLTLTVTDAKGRPQTVTIEPPELDAAEGTSLSEEGLAALREKLVDAFKPFQELMKSGTDSQSALFDIYSLMRLMIEISKQERQASREMRYAELERSVADVRNKAHEMRIAARNSLIMSAVFSAVSIATQAFSAFKSSRAQTAAAKMEATSGVNEAQQNMSLLAAKDSGESHNNLVKLEKSLQPEQVAEGQRYFADSKMAKPELEQAQTKFAEAKVALDQLKASDPTGAKAETQAAQTRFDAAKTALGEAEKSYATALDNDQNSLESALGSKRLALLEAEKIGNKDEVKAFKNEIKTLEGARQYGKAYVIDEKMTNNLSESLANDYKSAEHVFGQKAALLDHNAEYREAKASAQKWTTISQLLHQSGELGNTISQQVNAMLQASATEYEAAAKTDEAAREESNDLAANAQQLLKTVLDLLQAVQQAEAQSIQRIMA